MKGPREGFMNRENRKPPTPGDDRSSGHHKTPTVVTMGRPLSDGAVIEQIAGGQLLLKKDGKEQLGPSIEYVGVTYLPAPVTTELEQALAMPDRPADYDSINSLLQNVAAAIDPAGQLDSSSRTLTATFVLATWQSGATPLPPILNLSGPGGWESGLVDALRAVCRRAICILDCSAAQLQHLPPDLSPTLFVRQPSETALRRLLCAFRDRIVFAGDGFFEITGAIVAITARPLGLPALQVALTAPGVPHHSVSRQQTEPSLVHLRRQLLAYRLDRFHHVQVADFDVHTLGAETRPLASVLASCVDGDANAGRELTAALQAYDKDAKAASANRGEAVVLEALLVLIHEGHEDAHVGEITELANGILLARDERAKLYAREVGPILRERLGLGLERDKYGWNLTLGRTTAQVIHWQAHARGARSLMEPRVGCACCVKLFSDEQGSDITK